MTQIYCENLVVVYQNCLVTQFKWQFYKIQKKYMKT